MSLMMTTSDQKGKLHKKNSVTPNKDPPEGIATAIVGVVHANVGQKLVICDIFRVFTMSPPPKNVERDIYEYIDHKNKDTFFNKSVIHLTRGGGVYFPMLSLFFFPMPARKFLISWHITIFAVHAFCGTVGRANFVFFTFTQ
jgi:hypothetical protein